MHSGSDTSCSGRSNGSISAPRRRSIRFSRAGPRPVASWLGGLPGDLVAESGLRPGRPELRALKKAAW